MANRDNLGPAENYKWGKNHFDTLKTVFENLKTDINGRHAWNRPIEQLDGLNISFMGPDKIKVIHQKHVVAPPYLMTKKELPEASEFLDNLMKELAKKYKQVAETPVTFKLLDESQDTELASKLSPDRSWAGAGMMGVAIGRYILTTSRTYNVKSRNLRADSE